MGTDERRGDPRINRINLVQVSRFDEEGFRADLATGRTLNISRGGIRLQLHHPLPLRTTVSINLVLEERILDLSGTVVYLEAVDQETSQMGIRFEDIDEETAELLDSYMVANAAPPPGTAEITVIPKD